MTTTTVTTTTKTSLRLGRRDRRSPRQSQAEPTAALDLDEEMKLSFRIIILRFHFPQRETNALERSFKRISRGESPWLHFSVHGDCSIAGRLRDVFLQSIVRAPRTTYVYEIPGEIVSSSVGPRIPTRFDARFSLQMLRTRAASVNGV